MIVDWLKDFVRELFYGHRNEARLVDRVMSFLLPVDENDGEHSIKQCANCKELKFEDGGNTWCSICDEMICGDYTCLQETAYVMFPIPNWSSFTSNVYERRYNCKYVLCKDCYNNFFANHPSPF